MRQNFDHKNSLDNLFSMYRTLQKEKAQINSISINIEQLNQDTIGAANSQEIHHDDNENYHREDNVVNTGDHLTQTNRTPIGRACALYKVIHIQTKIGVTPVTMIYDTGSEISHWNF